MTYCHERNPAIELYRILLMLGIVVLHVLQAAGLGFSPMARWVEFCVDGFVFISGWYGIKFGWWKVVKIYGLALWCSALYLLAKWFCFAESPWSTLVYVQDVVKHAGWYWFVNAYVVLMCLAPIVNAALESRKSRTLFAPLLIVVFGWSFACMVPGLKAWIPHPTGFGSHTFLTLLGVYVVARIARLDKWDERFSTRQLWVALAILSGLAVFNLNKYNSPVAVLLGGAFFMLFNRLNLGGGAQFCANSGRAGDFAVHAGRLPAAWMWRGLCVCEIALEPVCESVSRGDCYGTDGFRHLRGGRFAPPVCAERGV